MKTSRALARDFSLCAERVNSVSRVGPRSVLYLLYLKHDQMIDKVVKTTTSFFIQSVIHPPGALFTLPERYSTFGE